MSKSKYNNHKFRDLAFDYQIADCANKHKIMNEMIAIMKSETDKERKELMKTTIKANIEIANCSNNK
jgi:hypothetical protein